MIRLAILGAFLSALCCTYAGQQLKGGIESQYLFVQISRSGTIEGDRLTLQDTAAQTIFFSDRPKRITGHLPTKQFVDLWSRGSNSFQHDPPNASLAFVAEGIQSAAVFELHDPILEGTNLSFRVRILQGSPPSTFADASLFIDAGGLMQLVAYGAQDVYE